MTAAKAVGHLYLGKIEVLRAAIRLQGHTVQQKAGCRSIDWWKPEGKVRTCRTVFASIGIRLSLPFNKFVCYPLVVSAEIAADCLHE